MISTPSNLQVNRSIGKIILASRCLMAIVVIVAIPAIIKHSLDLYSISYVCVGVSFFLLEFSHQRKILKIAGYFFAIIPVVIIGTQMYEFIVMEFFNYIDLAIMFSFILIACVLILSRRDVSYQKYINVAAILNVIIALACLRFSTYVAIELLVIGLALVLKRAQYGFMKVTHAPTASHTIDPIQNDDQELLAAMLQTSTDAIITFTLDDKIISWNKGAENIFGYSDKEAIGKSRGLIYENANEDLSIHDSELNQNRETERKRKDGSLVYVSSDTYAVRDSDGLLIGICEISHDITEEREAINKIASSERKIRALIENISEGIALTDSSSRVIFQSPSVTRILGYTAEERDGIPATDFVHPDHLAGMKKLFDEVSKVPGVPVSFQFQIRHKLGHSVWIEGTLTNLLHDPDIEGYITNYRDITERKEIEEKLRASEIRFKALIENSSDGILLMDTQLNTLYRSPSASKITGFGTVENNNAAIASAHPADAARIGLTFQEVLKNPGIAFPYQGRIKKKNGGYIWLEGSLTNLLHINGVKAIVNNFHDISERKKAEQEILKLNQELEEKVILRTDQLQLANKELEAFSYSVSHDLRAPLRIINGFSEILLEDHSASLDEKGQKTLNVIVRNAKKMGQLIDDLLEFSRVGRTALRLSSIDMNELAREVLQELKHSGISIPSNFIFHPMKDAYGDANLIKVIWTNLISNAVKYSSKKENPRVEVGMIEEGENLFYYVKDSGAGFEMRYVDKLFGVFQRLHKQEEFEGTGVGLALAQRVVVRHGGIIKATGELDKGATFYFSIPNIKDNISGDGNEKLLNGEAG